MFAGLLIAGILVAVAAIVVYIALKNAREDADSNFSEQPVAEPCVDCSPKALSSISRAGTDAFKRDEDGNIITIDDGPPIEVGHGGAPGTAFAVQPVKIQLQDGTWVEGYRSLNKSKITGGDWVTDYRFQADCHGVTFTNGQYWINDDQVETILAGGGFHQTSMPKIGDIGVYRDINGNVVHSVTVSKVDSAGVVTEVSGLGGIEMSEHTNTPATGWFDPNATITYYGQ